METIFCNLDFDYPENDMPDTFGDMSLVTNLGDNVGFGISIYDFCCGIQSTAPLTIFFSISIAAIP